MRLIAGILALCALMSAFSPAYASPADPQPPAESYFDTVIMGHFETGFAAVVNGLESVLFYDVFGFPAVVLWLIIGGTYFTVRLGFVNFRLFRHALKVVRGTYDDPDDPGEITHFQALSAAVSATVGLGNIAGVAVAVSMGGPGAVVWMMLAGFLGMSTKFAEVMLGHKFRHIDKNGKVHGGAFYYLTDGLAGMGYAKLGKLLALIFGIFCICASLGGGNMLQSNQSVKMLTDTYSALGNLDWLISLILAFLVGIVLIGGIRRIAHVAEAIVPAMAFIYVTAAIVVLIANAELVPQAVITMFRGAFGLDALGGGLLGALVMGFRRAAFSNEAGMGSAPIAHAAAKTKEPVREGCVALLEPFLDTIVICFMTGCIITVTGVYADESIQGNGVQLTSAAFATVMDWFPIVLSVSIALFAYSTMISWSYYGENAWIYLFGNKTIKLYYFIFCLATFLGGVTSFDLVLNFSDLLMLSMSLPNLLGLYFLQNIVRREMKGYVAKLKSGEFDREVEARKTRSVSV